MNFLSTLKNNKIVFVCSFFLLTSCQNIKTRQDIENEKAKQVPTALKQESVVPSQQSQIIPDINLSNQTTTPEQSPLLNPMAPVVSDEHAKISLILGPGGLRSYAHIGVIQELMKAKIPIYSVAGMEMGSLVAGIFSKKGQAYDVEWQMMKLKEEDFFKKNLVLSRAPREVTSLNEFIQTSLGNSLVEDAKIQFSCPAFNVAKRQIFVMNRGPYSSMLPYCIPYYPFFKPYDQNTAGLTSLVTTVKHLKSKGATYFIYVDLLSEKSAPFFAKTDSEENVTWSMVAQGLDQQLSVVNKVVSIPLSNFNLDDFAKRRDMIQRGQVAGKNLVRELQSELGY